MKKIEVLIDWNDNYGAVSNQVPGCVATSQTFEGVKNAYISALQFHLEGLKGCDIPDSLKGKYKLDFVLSVQALLHNFDGVITRAALSRATGINQKQLGHYMSGYRTPRPEKRARIVDGLHRIGKEFLSVV